MAYALVSSTNYTSNWAGGTPVSSGAINTTGVDLLVLVLSCYEGGGEPTISDNHGNTWTLAERSESTIADISIYYCHNPTTGTSHTFTSTGSGQYSYMAVQGFSGSGSSPLDQTSGTTTGSATSLSPGSITPTQANELVISAAAITDNTSAYSVDSSITVLNSQNWISNSNEGLIWGYKIQTTAAAINPVYSWTTAGQAAAVSASFKAVSSVAVSNAMFFAGN